VKISVGSLPYISIASVWQQQRPVVTDLAAFHHRPSIETSSCRTVALCVLRVLTHEALEFDRIFVEFHCLFLLFCFGPDFTRDTFARSRRELPCSQGRRGAFCGGALGGIHIHPGRLLRGLAGQRAVGGTRQSRST
jgi:hypothetical protein